MGERNDDTGTMGWRACFSVSTVDKLPRRQMASLIGWHELTDC